MNEKVINKLKFKLELSEFLKKQKYLTEDEQVDALGELKQEMVEEQQKVFRTVEE